MQKTLEQLYKETNGWTARHIIQDEIAMMGSKAIAGDWILEKVAYWEVKEAK